VAGLKLLLVREYAGHRRQVADVAVHHTEEGADGLLVGRSGIEIECNAFDRAHISEAGEPCGRNPQQRLQDEGVLPYAYSNLAIRDLGNGQRTGLDRRSCLSCPPHWESLPAWR
jgi:hypothetical protein